MKQKLYNPVTTGAILGGLMLCMLLLASSRTQADEQGFIDNFPGGVRVIGAVGYDGTRITQEVLLFHSADELKSALDEAWASNIPEACNSIKSEVAKAVYEGEGRTTRNQECELAKIGELRAKIADGFLQLKYIVRGNFTSFYVTTPGPWDRALDPRFGAVFDLEMLIRIRLPGPDLRSSLEAAEATVFVRNAGIAPINFQAATAMALGITSPEKLKKSADTMNAKTQDYTAYVNSKLQAKESFKAAIDAGFKYVLQTGIETDPDGQAGRVVFKLAKGDYSIPTSGAGVLSGRVRWPKTNGLPANGQLCSALSISASVQNAPDVGGIFGPPAVKSAGRVEAPVYTDAGAYCECTYAIQDLPLDVPLTLEVKSNGGQWVDDRNQPANWGVILGQPAGWANPITVRRASPTQTSTSGGLTGGISNDPRVGGVLRTTVQFGGGLERAGATGLAGADFDLRFIRPPK